MEASGVLVDSSVWVHFFRYGRSPEAIHLDALLQAKAVRTCPPIRTEILSGTRTDRERSQLREWFNGIPSLELPGDVWEQMEQARFTLARKGEQVSLIDLMIACTAAAHRAPLWTLDRGLLAIQEVCRFPRYSPEKE